jgi:hypothetical protein
MSISRAITDFFNSTEIDTSNEGSSSKKFLALIFSLIAGLILIISQKKFFRESRDKEGFTSEDRFKQQNIWTPFALAKLSGFPLDDQTALFFLAIGSKHANEFQSSTNQIIQLGISNGSFVTAAAKKSKRKVIGYDYSPVALSALAPHENVETRMINLNATNSKKDLAYQAQLEKDFSAVSDVLLIRILEYLNPEAVQLLLFSIIKFARPGSRFYIEILSPLDNAPDPTSDMTVSYPLKPGMISSLFAERKDFEIETLTNRKNPNDNANRNMERLLIKRVYS